MRLRRVTRLGCGNAPDDWHSWWRKCPACGDTYHASECCQRCADLEDEDEDEDDDDDDDPMYDAELAAKRDGEAR